jgi:GT2 family glycosyltransferase
VEHPTPGADAPDDEQDDGAQAPPAPPVVAVVVARDPGPWFEEAMGALAAQDYPNLSILVVDAASAEEVKPRVGRAAPGAFVRRLDDNPGFGGAANEVLEVVEGAAFYLVCHDDVAPDPDVTRLLVEEAFRSNAAIVGPKLVAWDDPRKLLQVGEGLDHAGYPAPVVDRGELDQEQHDAVRDVFTIPGACTLVRADLFAEIGGFDEGIDVLLDDVSLCWRTHLAGARVLVAPAARVRHVEALDQRELPVARSRIEARHRLRVVLSCYSALSLLIVLPKTVVLHLAEVAYALAVGRTSHAADVTSGWVWNLRRLGELRAARRQVRSFRHVNDREIRRFMVHGSARVSQFLRGSDSRSDDRLAGWARSGRDAAGSLRSGTFRVTATVWGIVAVVLLAGSRHLITRGVPAIGQLVPFTSSPLDLLREWGSGWRRGGLGSEAPAPTAFGMLGGLGFLSLGFTGLLRTILTVGLLPLGGFTAYRLAGPLGSRAAQIAALLVYLCNPLPYNALAAGRWDALALYAAVPTVVAVLARVARWAPFGRVGGTQGPGVRSVELRHRVAGLGLLTALLAALTPLAVVVVPGIALALAVGSLLAYRVAGTIRLLGAALAAALLAVLLHLPWSLDYLAPGTPLSAVVGVSRAAGESDLAALLRFDVGPMGGGLLGWAFLVAAALPLLIGKAERHAWAVRGWTMAVVFWGLAWASQGGELPFALPATEVLLAPAAAGLALSAAMGVAAFEVDLPGYRFGWRQMASGLAAAAIVLVTIPVLGASFDGRWSMPGGDHLRALSFMDAENDEVPFRVLWLGDPRALPLGSWELREGIGYATTDEGAPVAQELWTATSDDGRTRLLADAIDLAADGETARLGRLLAPMGVRYVVVPERLAPAPFATDELPVPGRLAATLDAQLDLEPLDVPAGLRVYRNQAAYPPIAVVPRDGVPAGEGGIAGAARVDLSTAAPALEEVDGRLHWSGPVKADTTVLLAQAHSERWVLTVDGKDAPRGKPYGWATSFDIEESGDATLRYETPVFRYGLLALQTLAWLWLARRLVKARFAPEPEPGAHTGGDR